MKARRMLLTGALLLAGMLLGPTSYAAATEPARELEPRTAQAPRRPWVRIGEVLGPSPTQRYRFEGRKGQRVIVQPDSWPDRSHGCVRLTRMRLGDRVVAPGAVGHWRLPRTATYELRVGATCVGRLSLRIRRFQQPRGTIGSRLDTRFTPTLMRSVRLTLPAKRTVLLDRESGQGYAYVAASASGRSSSFVGCQAYILSAGIPWSCGPGRVPREVIVSAPTATTAAKATVVDAVLDGPAVTIADPARTLVRFGVSGRTALQVESNATPVPRTLAQRDWIDLLNGRGQWWYGWVNTYRTAVGDGTWLPSGWVVERPGAYLFQVVDQGAVPVTGPLTLAVRTGVDPPPGELETWESPD